MKILTLSTCMPGLGASNIKLKIHNNIWAQDKTETTAKDAEKIFLNIPEAQKWKEKNKKQIKGCSCSNDALDIWKPFFIFDFRHKLDWILSVFLCSFFFKENWYNW